MRAISLFLAVTCAATTAFAQAGPQPGSTAPGVVAPGQPVLPGTVVGVPATAMPTTEIGFDAKVKRDPNGKIIEDAKTTAPVQAAPQLRNDRKLRGDSAILTQKPAPAPAPQPAQQAPQYQNNGNNGTNNGGVANANVINNNNSIPKLISTPNGVNGFGTTTTVNH